jgi:hypothetical protein
MAGLVEGGLTGLAANRMEKLAPELLAHHASADTPGPRALDELPGPTSRPRRPWRVTLVAVGVAALLLPFASEVPDALEVVVERLQAHR